jgi:hypothetical protein
MRSLDVPVESSGLRIEKDFVRQHGVEDFDDRLPLLVGKTDIGSFDVWLRSNAPRQARPSPLF